MVRVIFYRIQTACNVSAPPVHFPSRHRFVHMPQIRMLSSIRIASSNFCIKTTEARYIHQHTSPMSRLITIFQTRFNFGCSQTRGSANGGTVRKTMTITAVLQYHGSSLPGTGGGITATGRLDGSRYSMQYLHLTASS